MPEVPREDNAKLWKLSVVTPIRNRLWENPSIIGEYIKEQGRNLPDGDLRILSEWQRPVIDNFFIVKHLKNYTVFMNDERLYGVLGISNPIKETVPSSTIYVKAVLLPFAGRTIYDSVIEPYSIQLGGGVREAVNDRYRTLKASLGIVTSLSP